MKKVLYHTCIFFLFGTLLFDSSEVLAQEVKPVVRHVVPNPSHVANKQSEESERILGATNRRTVQISLELGKILIQRDKAYEGVPLVEEALKHRKAFYEADHHYIGDAHLTLGQGLTGLQQYKEAEQHLKESIRIFEANPPQDTAWKANAQNALQALYQAWGK